MLHARGTVIRTETPADVFWRMLTLATDTAGYTVQSIETYGDRRERERERERQRQRQRQTDRQTDTDTDTETETERQTETDRQRQREIDRETHRQTDRQTDRDRQRLYLSKRSRLEDCLHPAPAHERILRSERQTNRQKLTKS